MGDLPSDTTPLELRKRFERHGAVEFVALKLRDSKGLTFSFVGFESPEAAEAALAMDQSDVFGTPIKVMLSKVPKDSHRSVEYNEWHNERQAGAKKAP